MSASPYRTHLTAGAGMISVVVERSSTGAPVARFTWDPADTDGALGELVAALGAAERLQERRERCRAAEPRRPRRPRHEAGHVGLLDDVDHAIEVLELGAVRGRCTVTGRAFPGLVAAGRRAEKAVEVLRSAIEHVKPPREGESLDDVALRLRGASVLALTAGQELATLGGWHEAASEAENEGSEGDG
jgi:hypothetical protein